MPFANERVTESRNSMTSQFMKWNRIAIVAILVIVLAAVLWAAAGAGQWLIVEDSLAKADAIVVFGGMLPFRSMEAAALYRQGLAPEIWLPALEPSAAYEYTKSLGLNPRDPMISLQVLDRERIPVGAIRILSAGVKNTREEVELALYTLRQRKGKRLILVTSPPHTRRVKALWNHLAGGGEESIVRYASINNRYQPIGWWTRKEDFRIVRHETAGLAGIFLGF